MNKSKKEKQKKKYRKKILLYMLFVFVVGLIGYAFIDLVGFEFSSCGYGYQGPYFSEEGKAILTPSCHDWRGYLEDLDENVGAPLIIFSIAIFILLFVFLFVREEIFDAWFGFSKRFVLTMIIIALLLPDYSDMFFHSDQVSRSFAWSCLFVGVSLLFIVLRSLRIGDKFWEVFRKILTWIIIIIAVGWTYLTLVDM